VILALSAGLAPHPPIVAATPSAGEGSVAVCDPLRAVDKARLTRMAGALAREDLHVVEDGVRAVLQL
jgi:mRNA interferase MazF